MIPPRAITICQYKHNCLIRQSAFIVRDSSLDQQHIINFILYYRMVDVFRALGCTVSADTAAKRSDSYTPKHYNIVLQIPLVFPNLQKGSRKRRN